MNPEKQTTIKPIPTGLFISLEGIDGAGKSSHVNSLLQAFTAKGKTVTQTREPGGTKLAEQLRLMALSEPMDALTEALIMFAARRDHIQNCIAPALMRDEVVLCDRFVDATFAYQGGGRGVNWNTLEILEQTVLQLDKNYIQPHLTLWFDLPAEIAAARLAKTRVADRFEEEDINFFERVQAAYARRAQEFPNRIVRIDSSNVPEVVAQSVHMVLVDRGLL